MACWEYFADFTYYVLIFLVPVVAHLVFFYDKGNKSGSYSAPGWYYPLKFWYAKHCFKKILKKCKSEDYWTDDLELPQEVNDTASDSYLIYGSDQTGNLIHLRLVRHESYHSVSLILYLENGDVYTLPETLGTIYCNNIPHEKLWKAGGLNIEILQSFRRLRIMYNGLLKKTATSSTEHVQFRFIWASAGKPLFYPKDADFNVFADALSREKWRDGDWLQMLGDEIGFEQFGAMRGIIKGENILKPIELNLASYRKRYRGTADSVALRRDLCITGSAEDGTVFCVGAKSYKPGKCAQVRYGSILYSNMEVHSIKICDINLINLAENKVVPEMFTLHFEAGNRNYKSVFHVKTLSALITGSEEIEGWKMITVPAECDFNSCQARAMITFWYSHKGVGINLPQIPIPLQIPSTNEHLVLDLKSEQAKATSVSGGKGSSLALLQSVPSDEFSIPPGFIVTVKAFENHVKENYQITKEIVGLQQACCESESNMVLICEKITKIFRETPIAEDLINLINGQLNAIKDTTEMTWAVRSSGVDEDCDDISAAGQNATFLGCTNVTEAIKACWSSLFTLQSVQYRRQRGLPIFSKIAVVIQKMVPSDSAGVLFTCHPSTGNPSQMVITSNFGLGESVVSGEAEPDTITLKKTSNDQLVISSRTLGQKAITTKLTSKGTESLPTKHQERFSLSDEQILKLGQVALKLERFFGDQRDLEWAFHDNLLYLLQSRPVTTLNNWTDFELTHEFDCPVLSEQNMYTKANIGEVIPGAITALTQSVTTRILDEAIQLTRDGTYDPYMAKAIFTCWHQVFVDVLACVMPKTNDVNDINTQVVSLAIFGHPVFTEEMCKIIVSRNNGRFSPMVKISMLILYLKMTLKNSRCVTQAIHLNKNTNIEFTTKNTSKEIYSKIDSYIRNSLTPIAKHHCNTTSVSIFYQIFTMTILAGQSKELTPDHLSDITLLLSSCEAVVSAEVPTRLEKIANILRELKQAVAFANISPEEGVQWLKANCKEAYDEFKDFLNAHGHRMFKEFELIEYNWSSKPEQVVKMIQANVRSAASITQKTTSSLTVEETVGRLKSSIPSGVRKFLKFLVSRSRKAVGEREQTKSELVRSINKVREAYRSLGAKMVEEGFLPRTSLVFHLTHGEVNQLLRKRNPSLVLKALRREKLYPKWDKYTFPEISYGFPIPDEEKEYVNLCFDSTTEAKGTPVCAGDVLARACVIKSLSEINQLKSGDILITICTDIAWSPYFPMLGGVITELGGIISHGAVVAREYGLPCVVGVKNATKIFETGDHIFMSGTTGIIRKTS